MRVLIKNGIVVNADGQAKQDLLIESGIVRQLGTDISPQLPCEEIDASGCYVFPGGVDVHTHFNIDVGIARSCDDFFTGTRAAACGGTTTIIDHMGFGPNGCRLRHQLEVYRGYAAHKAVIDYSFHGVIQHINHAILDEIPMMVEEGLSSFKLYLTYQYKLNDDEVLQALRRLHESGALTTVHPENDAAIASKRAEFIAAGLTAPRYHALSRPLECEAEAIARMINLAQIAGNAPLYIVHLSNGLGLDYLRLARANHQPVWVETCPQYLLLDERSYDTEDGMKFILSPPLRNVREQDKLWCGISDGAIDVVATGDIDTCVAQFIMNKYNMSADDCLTMLNKKSGVLALSDGVSSDFRDLDAAAEKGNEAAQLALDKFAYEVRKYIGAYAAALGGVDCIVFTAGVGENSGSMRASICDGLEYLGVKLDPEKNKLRGEEVVISTSDSKVTVWVIPTNEELMIAQDTAALTR